MSRGGSQWGIQLLEIRLLGPFEISLDGRLLRLPGRRLAALVTVLALSPDLLVPVEVIVDRLWGEQMPRRARSTLHTYVARLRRCLGDHVLETRPTGYRLRIEPDRVDAIRLASLVREAAYESDDTRKRKLLESAAGLWRDVPFAGAAASDWLSTGEAARLTEIYLSAVEQRIDLDLAAGRYGGLPTELQELTVRHPLREPLWVRRLAVLRLTGRTAEALECYEQVRTLVADAFGVDPAPALQQEFARLIAPRNAEPAISAAAVGIGPPRQLPPDLRTFTGRASEHHRLDDLLDDSAADRSTIITLTGPGGVGKTSLAVRWAHRVRERFPDGQLFVDLRGFSAEAPVPAGAALLTLLHSLHVPMDQVPPETPERAALFRTLTADRSFLLVLDNASSAEQVRPLLPASGSVVLITSRNQLRSLGPAVGATRVPVEPLPADQAVALLIDAVGADRVAAERSAATELTALCAGLPLALAIVAEAACRMPALPLAQLVDALGDEKRTLDVFADPDDDRGDLRQVLSWSYRTLEPGSALLFRLLGLLPAGSVDVPVVAALAGISRREAERRLDQLDANHQVIRIHRGRYQLHDLVRTYAAELAAEVDDDSARRAAIGRALDWYLHTLQNAALAAETSVGRGYLVSSAHTPLTFADAEAAMEWLWANHFLLASWIRLAISHGDDDHAWRIAWKLRGFLDLAYLVNEAVEVTELFVEAAERLGDARVRYLAWNALAWAEFRAGRPVVAQDCGRRAIQLARHSGDVGAEITIRINLAHSLSATGALEDALAEMNAAEAAAANCRRSSTEPLPVRPEVIQSTLGGINLLLGRLDEAERYLVRAVRLARTQGRWHEEAEMLNSLAELHELRGDDPAADFYAREALDRLQGLRSPTASFDCLALRARVADRGGRPEAAAALARQALAHLPDGHPSGDQLRELIESPALSADPPVAFG